MLFVPAHRQQWLRSAGSLPSDGLVIDLEDAVPPNQREQGRDVLVDETQRGSFGDLPVFVRINGPGSEDMQRDVEAVVAAGVDGVAAPKLVGPADVHQLDELLAATETAKRVPVGSVGLMPLLETAPAIHGAYAIATASPRVVGIMGGAPRGADVNRAIGYQWTEGGLETLYIRSQVVLAGRAAGLPHVISFPWLDLDDRAAFERETIAARQLGFSGRAAIHPSHVEFINKCFSPSPEEIAYYEGLIEAMREAEARGEAATRYQGGMVDLAHVEMARDVLALAGRVPDQGRART
jgi:citrate lyase subunit beta/citryl-CoA lyase